MEDNNTQLSKEEYYLKDTRKHIDAVAKNMCFMIVELSSRLIRHDSTKFQDPEYTSYSEVCQDLSRVPYRSPEHLRLLEKIYDATEHHKSNNRHHPEYFENGVNDMTLIDIMEMVADWKGAAECRGGNIMETLHLNKERFNIDDQLWCIIENTMKMMVNHVSEGGVK